MPGDHKYASPEIPIVIVWNGLNHYVPTYSANNDVILHWKLSLINRHISEAISLFGEVEGDLNDQTDFDLCEQFHLLKSTADQSKKLLENTAGKMGKAVIPPTHIGPDPRDIMTSLTRCTTLAEHPLPHFKGYMLLTLESVVDVAAAANYKLPLILQVPNVPTTQPPTNVVQSHSTPIPCSRSTNFLPPPPQIPIKEDVFNFPLGEYLEVKRKSGEPFKVPDKPAPKPKKEPSISGTDPSIIVSIPLYDLPPGQNPVSSSSAPPHPPAEKTYDSRAHSGQASHSGQQSVRKACDSQSRPGQGKSSGKDPREKPCDSRAKTSAPVSSSSAGPSSSLPSILQGLAQAAAQTAISKSKGKSSGKGKGPMKFTCIQPGCTYSTFNKGDFSIHMDKHYGVKYKCSACKKEFGSTKARDTHIRTVHLKQHRAQCPEQGCTFSHNDHGVTRVHLYTDHGIGQEPKCRHPDCEGRDLFTNYRVYERHIKTFHIPKDQVCPHANCGKKYKGADRLSDHIQSAHKDKVTLQCDECGKFFA